MKIFVSASLVLCSQVFASDLGPFVLVGDMLVYYPETSVGVFAASKLNVEKWEDGVLPLVFASTITAEQKNQLFSACAEWSQVAKVRCQEGAYKGRKLSVTDDENGGCFAIWGMGRAYGLFQRMMNLAPGCWNRGTLLHEIGHAIGLIHEHQRSDRDEYVTIHEANIDSRYFGWERKLNFDVVGADTNFPYDFRSIMHYPRDAYSSNGKDTITPKPAYMEFIDLMGNIDELSSSDAAIAAKLYGAP